MATAASRILLTGGAGFLGASVATRLLAAGHAVRIFDRRTGRTMLEAVAGPDADPVEIVAGDVADPAALRHAAAGCDAIIHLAALLTPDCADDPIRGATVNVLGTLSAFEAARANGIARVAYASSAAVFGPDSGEVPFPITHYGAFKLACEGAARAYWIERGIASVGLRPLVVFGPGREVGSTAGISLACRHAAVGQPYVIPFTGRTDAIFVDDVAAAFVAAATRPIDGAHVFTLTGELVSVDEVIAAIRLHCPDAALSASGPELPIAPDLLAGVSDAVLGGLPRTPFEEGVARTVAFYRGRAG